MPVYEYECRTCVRNGAVGIFCHYAPMEHYKSRQECPTCHTYARRILSLPNVVGTMKVKSYNHLDQVLGVHCESSKEVDQVCAAKGLARVDSIGRKPQVTTVDKQMVAEKYLRDVN